MAVFHEKRSKEEEETGSYLVAIDYGPGFVLYLHPASYDGKAADDPEKQYHLMADDLNAALGSIASVQTVQGVAALVIEQAPGGVASVDLVLPGGLRVQLIAEYAPTMKAAQLVEIAESLK